MRPVLAATEEPSFAAVRAEEDAEIASRIRSRKTEQAAALADLETAAVNARIASAEAACDRQAVHSARVAHKLRQILVPGDTTMQDIFDIKRPAFDVQIKRKKSSAWQL